MISMAKKTYSVTIEERLMNDFRELCREQAINQSMLIESFMRAYVNGSVKLALVNNKPETTMEE